MKIIVLAGGNSDERAVSLRSGAAVVAALEGMHEVELIDPVQAIESYQLRLQMTDVVFPALHGAGGEDGVLQAFLEAYDIRFVGSGSAASKLCFDKNTYSYLLNERGFSVPDTDLVTYEDYIPNELRYGPYVLKPNDGGSSVDTFIVRDTQAQNNYDGVHHKAFLKHTWMLIQELIVGIELTVGVLGDTALPVIEIVPPADQEFDYENKYNGATQELCPPKHINAKKQQEAQDLALQIHKITGCQGMSRTDFILDKQGTLYVLETNTIPGLTDQSLLPKAADTAGISMPELCEQLVQAALKS